MRILRFRMASAGLPLRRFERHEALRKTLLVYVA
jgi:hypothetical protein